MEAFRFTAGGAPLLVSMPHVGLTVPEAIRERMSEPALALPDTDWHVDRLYDFLEALDVSWIAATHSRYVIDLNRAPDGKALYSGARETELCPTTSFADQPLYRPGQAPDEAEVAERRAAYWQPYHDRLNEALETLRDGHGQVVLWDAHSILSQVPRFFEGRLPDLNLGSRSGSSADLELIGRLEAVAAAAEAEGYSHALDGRFKGGFITRNYGRPQEGIHALQLELSQSTYMEEQPPFSFREDLAEQVRPVLRRLLETALAWARAAG